jgi:hypothetical protein
MNFTVNITGRLAYIWVVCVKIKFNLRNFKFSLFMRIKSAFLESTVAQLPVEQRTVPSGEAAAVATQQGLNLMWMTASQPNPPAGWLSMLKFLLCVYLLIVIKLTL